MRIEYPSDAEREASIQAILAAGLTERPTLRRALGDLWRALGLRGLLCGMGDCVALALALTLCALLLVISVLFDRAHLGGLLYPLTAGAPLPYAALLLLTEWKEEQLGTRELKMTVRYDLRHLTAMRLILFSGVGVLVNLLLAAVTAAVFASALLFVQLFTLSLSALFLYVSLTLVWLLYIPARWQPTLPALWLALSTLPSVLLPAQDLSALLEDLPLAGTALFFLLAAGLACCLIRTYLLNSRKGDKYAYC